MPEVVGGVLLGAELAGTVLISVGTASLTLGSVVGGAALAGGAIGLQLLTARSATAAAPVNSSAQPPPESGHQALKQAIPPRIVGYGRNRLAGSYLLYEEKSGISYDVQGFHHGRVGAIKGYYLHDDVVEINGSGVVQIQGDDRYGDGLITIDTRLGADPSTAFAPISSALPTIWGAAYRGDGLATASLICGAAADPSDFTVNYPHGKPELSLVVDCAPIFDPRDDDQDRIDESTWLVSSNPVLQLLDQLTNADRGMGLDWDILIEPVLDDLMAQADLCDVLVPRKDGAFEQRYTCDLAFSLDGDPADVVQAILDSCDGWMSENGDGTLALRVGVYSAPTFTLEAEHIKGFSIQYGTPDEEVVNELTLEYTSPSLDYKTAPGYPLRDEADIAARGVTRSKPLSLKSVQSHSQGQRLLKRRMAQLNAPLRGTITTTLYGLRGLGERWIKIEAPQYPDLVDLWVEVRGATIDLLRGQLVFRFVSVDPVTVDAWDAATEEGDEPVIPEKLVAPPPPVPQNITADDYGFGTGFDVYLDDPGRSDLQFQARYRIGVGTWTEGARHTSGSSFQGHPPAGAPGRVFFFAASGLSSATYEIQARAYAPAGVPSGWSSSTTLAI